MFKQKSALILDQMKLPAPQETIFELPILNSVVWRQMEHELTSLKSAQHVKILV